jgi:prepilin-type N-terminal cleavage/methylation domain-containing protein
MRHHQTKSRRREAGFSLIELSVSILVLVIVMGAVFSQVNNVQKNTHVESMKLDLTQQNREFVDQFARDLHMSGYPVGKIYQYGAQPTDANVALGLVFVSPTKIRFEGDVYGDGNVYSVVYQYVQADPNDPNCPCLRRSAQFKQAADPVVEDPAGAPKGQFPPVFYTEVQNIIDPTGMAQGIFSYFTATGAQVPVPPAGLNGDLTGDLAQIQTIDAVKVNVSTRSQQSDFHGQQVVNSISSIAQLEN